jgi:FAD synthase
LRDEMKFPSVQDLRDQIARDVSKAHRFLHKLRKYEG